MKILQNFVAFSEYMNFTIIYSSPHSQQYGGFGGGGAGCYGGGGGGGFIGGAGGTSETTNGLGGFSYYNPEAVKLVLDSRDEMNPKTRTRQDQIIKKEQEKLWQHQGPGFVYILPSLSDATCQVIIVVYMYLFYVVILTTYLLLNRVFICC